MLTEFQAIAEIGRTDFHALVRARRHRDNAPVLLKAAVSIPPRAIERRQLEHEHEILRQLRVPGIPASLVFISGPEHCCLVLEDRGGVVLCELLDSRQLDMEWFFAVALDLAEILGELHQLDIIHQRISPASILVQPENGEVTLLDFSGAARNAGEVQAQADHSSLRALRYFSPEQTGRMNRAVDYRADFYSLGAVFHEMLTGAPPFQSDDPVALIHAHIARSPVPPHEVNAAIPDPLSSIVMKLLAKSPDHRYQSARGLRADLEHCGREWKARRSISPFQLGQRDISDRFLIPQKLYGRAREVETLVSTFNRASAGAAELLLVAGYSGIGKTSFVHELCRPTVRQSGYFITGKFDQVARDIPYGALFQAFRAFMQQLLAENDESQGHWRAQLGEALGVNGGVIAEVIPEIEFIIGKQAPPPPLGPKEAQNRFQLVFQNLLGALARRENPLVIFLDDLQWADLATLGLLHVLLTNPDSRHFLIIGAYRDNEVNANHPLVRAVAELEAVHARVDRLKLGPLHLPELTQLIGDTMRRTTPQVEPLARLLKEKTDGNPFFVGQFLKTLHQEKLLSFDANQNQWTFKTDAIARAGMTDNVIDLMTSKIRRLPHHTQSRLMLAACIGKRSL
jgi:serine/threonine protein kinase